MVRTTREMLCTKGFVSPTENGKNLRQLLRESHQNVGVACSGGGGQARGRQRSVLAKNKQKICFVSM